MGLLLDAFRGKSKKRNYKVENILKEIEDEFENEIISFGINNEFIWLKLSEKSIIFKILLRKDWIIVEIIKLIDNNMYIRLEKINTIKELRKLIQR